MPALAMAPWLSQQLDIVSRYTFTIQQLILIRVMSLGKPKKEVLFFSDRAIKKEGERGKTKSRSLRKK